MGIYLGDTSVVSGGGGGGGGGYIGTERSTATGGSFQRAPGATMAIVGFDYSASGQSCTGQAITILNTDTCRFGTNNCVWNVGGLLCFCGCGNKTVSFFGPTSGKVGFVDVLIVGGGGGVFSGSTGVRQGGGGGGVQELISYPIYGIQSVDVGKAGCSYCASSASGCPWNGYPSRFGLCYACGGTCKCSGFPQRNPASSMCGYSSGNGGNGGAGGVGQDGTFICNFCARNSGCAVAGELCQSGNGGAGYYSAISGEGHYYGGGGGGSGHIYPKGSYETCPIVAYLAGQGQGGGGNGQQAKIMKCDGTVMYDLNTNDSNATYYGGGAGGTICGSYNNKACGCQGIVIVRYKTNGSCGLLPTSYGGTRYTCGDYTIHCFTDTTFTDYFQPVFK